MNGGYVLINGSGVDVSKGATEQNVTGFYAELISANKTGKPVFIGGMIAGTGVSMSPVQGFIKTGVNSASFTFSTMQINVTSADVITVTDLTAAAAASANVETRTVTRKK